MRSFAVVMTLAVAIFAVFMILTVATIYVSSLFLNEPTVIDHGSWDMTREPVSGRKCVKVAINSNGGVDYLCEGDQ